MTQFMLMATQLIYILHVLASVLWLAETSIMLFVVLPVLKRPKQVTSLYPVLRRLVNFTGMSVGLSIPTALYLFSVSPGVDSILQKWIAISGGVIATLAYLITLLDVKKFRNSPDRMNLKKLSWILSAEFTCLIVLFMIMFA